MKIKALVPCWDHINKVLVEPGKEEKSIFEMPEAQAKSLIGIGSAEEVKAVVPAKPKAE